jgi:hypothetical protein
MNDYVIVLNTNRNVRADQRWRIQRNHAPVMLPDASGPLAFATRQEAEAWIVEQQAKETAPCLQ